MVQLQPADGDRALARSEPRVLAHLESGDDVLIVEGLVSRAEPVDVPVSAINDYTAKYGGEWDPSDPTLPWFRLAPRTAMSWDSSDIRNSAARYDFP